VVKHDPPLTFPEFAPALLGLFMAFFGGFYFTTFAAIEAYRVCGWQKTVECLKELYEDFRNVLEANQLDQQEVKKAESPVQPRVRIN
jgi:hypothetical protein